MQGGESTVKAHDLAAIVLREGDEVGVGHLTVADDAAEVRTLERQCIWPEPVPSLGADRLEHADRFWRAPTFAQQEAEQGALGDRARGEVRGLIVEPLERDLVVDVLDDRQGNEHIAIGQERAHPSSSSERTSSTVTARPIETLGIPRGPDAIAGGL